MAGQRRRSTRRQGPSRRDVSIATSASTSASTSVGRDSVTLSVTSSATVSPVSHVSPGSRPSPRITYRNLLRRGLGPDEAANLTAFLFGIPVGAHHWDVKEINRILFLRELTVAGRFGHHDGAMDTPR